MTYANKLKEAGFTERQAQAQAEALVAVVDANLATKHDLKELEAAGKLEIELVRRDVKELELKFEGRFLLINWMLGFILAGVLSIMLKTFFTH